MMIMMGKDYCYDESSYWTLGEYATRHITESSKKNGAGYEIETEVMHLSISERVDFKHTKHCYSD